MEKKKMSAIRRLIAAGVSVSMMAGCLGGCVQNDNPGKESESRQESGSETEQETGTGTEAVTEAPTEGAEFDYSQEYVLKDIYADDFLVGTIYNYYTYKDELAWTQFNVWTAENDMKPDQLQPYEGDFNLINAMDILDFAASKDVSVHGHVLVWHQQSPSYMAYNCTREKAIEQMKTHIYEVVTNLDEGIISWDVVNEAIADGAKLPADGNWRECLRDSQWTRSIGDDFIDLAFRFAEEAINEVNPDIKLYYNDYNLDNYDKAKIVCAMVEDLKSQGIRIDGVGMQGHYSTETSVSSVENSISMFRELDVEISITELDLGVYGAVNGKLTEDQELLQAQRYAQLFQIYKENSDVIERVTFWGHYDAQSWRADNAPSLYDTEGNPKEAFYAVADPDNYLLAHPITDRSDEREATAVYGTVEVDGEIDATWDDAISYTVDRQLTAWEGATGTVKLMWDEEYLYMLMEVTDGALDASSGTKAYQDSIEVYLDQMNDKTVFYGVDDGQYRVNYKNEVSFGTVPDNADAFISAAKETSVGYIVEAAIPFAVTPYEDREMGFECQINDAKSGTRQSIAKFCDTTDNSYQSTENWGTVILTK